MNEMNNKLNYIHNLASYDDNTQKMTMYNNFKIEFVDKNDIDIEMSEFEGEITYNQGGVMVSGYSKHADGDCYEVVGFYPYHIIQFIGYDIRKE